MKREPGTARAPWGDGDPPFRLFVESVKDYAIFMLDRSGYVATGNLNIPDNGIGVPRGEQSRIFTPFERLHADAVYPGTGLGLAIAAEGVHRLGGELGVESGRSHWQLFLGGTRRIGPTLEVTRVASPILVAEDNEDEIVRLRRALSLARVTVPVAVVHDGVAAVDYLASRGAYADRARHPLPQLIILDLKLPRLSGLGVLKWLREQPGLRRLPVVVLTSSDEERYHPGL